MAAQSGGPYRLHVAVDRGDGPVYVLLHGINSTGHDWDTVVTAIGFDHRCIAVDELGYGESPKPMDIDYTIDDHVAALHYTLKDMDIYEPFTLVGYSMGGPIALRYAADYPEDVKRLLLISAPFYLDPEEIGEDQYAKAVFQTEGSQAVLNLVTSEGFKESRTFARLSADDKHMIQDFINSRDLKTDWEILQKNIRNVIAGSEMASDLKRVKAPTVFMVGERDAFIVRSQIETLRQKYAPNMEIRMLADLKADHMLLMNIPTVMAGEILKNEDRRLSVAMDRGEGPLLVLLHGVENDGSYWNQVGFALAQRNRVVVLDLLGFGQSPKPLDIAYNLDDHIGSIEATLASLLRDPDEPMTLIGHSLGGIIAAEYARRHPEQVTRLVIFSPPVNHQDVPAGDAMADRARATFVDNFGALRQRGMNVTSKGVVRNVLGLERLSRFIPSLRSLEHVVEAEDVAGDLLAVPHIPVTVVYGTKDPFVVPAYAESFASLRPGIDVVRLEAGHNIATEQPFQSVKLIDPLVDDARAEIDLAAAAKDPKLRPQQSSWALLLKEDMPLIIFRAVLYLALGIGMLLLPPTGDIRLLNMAFAIFVFARSVSLITGVFTTQSIKQEKLTNAASGFVGIAVGIFLVSNNDTSAVVLGLVASAYLLFNGAVDLFAASRTSRKSRRWSRLVMQGVTEILLAILLLLGSAFAVSVIKVTVAVGSIMAGVMLLSYAVATARLGQAFNTDLE